MKILKNIFILLIVGIVIWGIFYYFFTVENIDVPQINTNNKNSVKTKVSSEKLADLLNLYSAEIPVEIEINQEGIVTYLLIDIYKDHDEKAVFSKKYNTGVLLQSEENTEIRKGKFSCSWLFNSYLLENEDYNFKILDLSYFGAYGEKEPLDLRPYFEEINVTSDFKFPKAINIRTNKSIPFAIVLGNRKGGILADYNPYGIEIKELIKEYDLVFVMSFLPVEYDRDIRR